MAFLSRLFSKNTEDYLAKGDRLFVDMRFFEARTAYQDGLQKHLAGKGADISDEISGMFTEKIALANKSMAEANLLEAEHALGRGDHAKADEHIELAKILSDDTNLQEKAEKMLANFSENINDTKKLTPTSAACASCTPKEHETGFSSHNDEPDLSPLDYYDLLIRQLPGEMYSRYALLNENFVHYYVTASGDKHAEAIELLEKWYDGSCKDIYRYEKGMMLYRLGNSRDAEILLREAIRDNDANPLPWMGLALLLMDAGRSDEAACHLDVMIANEILPENARMLRGDACLMAGDTDGAIKQYGSLLSTPFAIQSAGKLHDVLLNCNRHQEAKTLYERYLKGCCN